MYNLYRFEMVVFLKGLNVYEAYGTPFPVGGI